MESTLRPPSSSSRRSNLSNSLPKLASRLERITYSLKGEEPPQLSLDLIPTTSPPKNPSTPSTPSLKSSTSSLPFQELLLLSPSPSKKSRTRLVDRLEMAAEEAGVEPYASLRRSKSRAAAQLGFAGCASPRNNRRIRRRAEMESDLVGLMEEIGKVRKRKHSGRSKKEKLSLAPSIPPSSPCPRVGDADGGNLDAIGAVIYDLIMWKDVAKTSLWFGFGFLFFFSSCFAKGVNFSIFSAISQLALIFLGASFMSNSICQRNDGERVRNLKLSDEDMLRVGGLILPVANFTISKTRELFSGEPSMTLKVIPFLLLGAEYGHLLTLWRLCAAGFFVSFTIPKLYSSYSNQIAQKVECTKCRVLEAWGVCSHKKVVVASAVTAFWNLSSIKTRLFAAFISLVILRYCRQHLLPKQDGEEAEEGELHKALVVAEPVASQKGTQ